MIFYLAERDKIGVRAQRSPCGLVQVRRRNVLELRGSLAGQQALNHERQERKADLGHQLSNLKVRRVCAV